MIQPSSAEARATRTVILVLAAAGFASTFAGRLVDPVVGVVAADLASRPETIALLATAYAIPYAFIQPVLGPVGDALGKIRVMRACLVVLGLALAASAVVTDTSALFGLRIVSGAAAGGVIPLALATIGDRVALEKRQIAISRFLVAVVLGQLAGSSLSGLLAGWIGWRGVFVLACGLALSASAASLVGGQGPARRPSAFSVEVALARYRKLLRNPRAVALFALVFVEAIPIFGIFPFLAPLLEERRAGGPAEAGLALAGFAVGGLIYSALVGWMLRVLGLSRMLIGGGIVAACALAAVGFSADWRLYAAALTVLGLGFYMLHNSFQTQVTEVAPDARGSAVALHAFSFFTGGALGPVFVGLGLRTIGQGPTMLLAAAVILILGFVAAWAMARTTPRAAP